MTNFRRHDFPFLSMDNKYGVKSLRHLIQSVIPFLATQCPLPVLNGYRGVLVTILSDHDSLTTRDPRAHQFSISNTSHFLRFVA